MGLVRGFLFIGIWVLSSLAFAATGLEAPPLRAVSYESLRLPVQLTKTEVQWLLQSAMDGLYGKAFVDMGDISDLMHGHVILKPKEGSLVSPIEGNDLENILMADVAQRPDLEAIAILFHSQEYDFLRKGLPYLGPYGELDPLNRNWLLFLKDSGKFKRGQLVDANEFYKKPDGTKPLTINISNFGKSVFGFDTRGWEYSFYFFRTDCEVSDNVQMSAPSNIIEVYNSLKKDRVCLAITSLQCRNHPEDQKNCTGVDLPQYNIFSK